MAKATGKMSARARQTINMRDEILRAAATMFADRGFEAVTVREISSAVGVGAPTIYHHFGDKQQLYRTVVLDQHLRSETYLADGLEAVNSIADFHRWLEMLVVNAFARTEHEKLQLREFLSPDDDIKRALAQKGFQPLYELLREKMNMLAPGIGDGALPVFLFAAAFGFVTLFPQRQFLENYGPGLDQQNLVEAERADFVHYLQTTFDHAVREARAAATPSEDDDVTKLRETIAALRSANLAMMDQISAFEARIDDIAAAQDRPNRKR